MVDQLIRAQFDFSNTPGATPTRPILQGGFAVQQADGKLLSRKPDGTTRVTDIRGIVDQLATGPLATAFGLKADLVNGLVPIAQLPPGFGGGGGGPVTSNSITDASATGKSVLTGTPAAGRVALQLGTAATRDIGTAAGTIAAGDDPRFNATVGTVTTDKITDASATGRAVVTGTPSAGRAALQALGLGKTVGPDIDWQNFNTHQTSTLLNVGGLPDVCFPGGNTVGCYSAIMGAVDIKTPGQNQASTFAAGVGGIVRSTMSNLSPCGIFGAAMANTPDGTYAQIFPANFVVTNQRDLNPYTTSGVKRAEMYGIEIDMEVHPADDGSQMIGHARGIWITGNSRIQPTGEFTGVLIGPAGILRTPRVKWKKAFRSQLGAAEVACEAGELNETGACSSQPIIMIGRNSSGQSLTNSLLTDQDGNLLARVAGAALVIQNSVGASTSITLRTDGRLQAINADLSSSLTVGGNAAVNGTLTASVVNLGTLSVGGNGSVGGNLTVNATLTASTTNTGTLNVSSNAGVGGNLTVNGSATAATGSFGSMYFQGQPVLLCAAGPIPAGYKGLMIPA